MKVLFLGDIVGRPGRRVCREHVHAWREKFSLDAVIANAENASGGNGLTVKNADELFGAGIDFLTSGNHIWKQRDYDDLFRKYSTVIRPANYPDENPGKGWGTFETVDGVRVGVLNLLGQVYLDPIDSPWTAADRFVPEIAKETKVIIVDIHAEATSERMAMGIYLDGRVSAVLGTHTHVPSADTRILPGGTAYQTDIGMVGPMNGVLGVDSEAILKKFRTYLPARFEVAGGPVICSGTLLTIDLENGKSLTIERFEEIVD